MLTGWALGSSISPWFYLHLPWTLLQSLNKPPLESGCVPGPKVSPGHCEPPLKITCALLIPQPENPHVRNQYSQRGLLGFPDPGPNLGKAGGRGDRHRDPQWVTIAATLWCPPRKELAAGEGVRLTGRA